jgi:FtsH-binding integral membrane protein
MEEVRMNRKSAFEVYLSAVYKWGIIALVSACMFATAMFVVEKTLGFYQVIPWLAVIIFGLMDACFFATGMLILKSSFDEDGYLKDGKLQVGNYSARLFLSSNGTISYTWFPQGRSGDFYVSS